MTSKMKRARVGLLQDACRHKLMSLFATYMASMSVKWNAKTVSHHAAGNARFYEILRENGGYNVVLYDRIVEWFSDNWPDDVRWPVDVERPPLPDEEEAETEEEDFHGD